MPVAPPQLRHPGTGPRLKLQSLAGGAAEVVGPEIPLSDVAQRMIETGTDAVAVVDRTGLIGICTGRDLVRAVAAAAVLSEEPVRAWMTAAPDTFAAEVPVTDAAEWLLETGYRHLPVMDGDELVGIVDVRDLLWALTRG